MGVSQGYSSVITNGLVFAYDAADSYNSYRGQPGTNITTGPNRNYSGYSKSNYSPGYFIETNGYTEIVNIPAIGETTAQSIEINNAYTGYGDGGNFNCCVNLFNYTGGWNSPIWSGNTAYTYQIIYKCTTGYTNSNYMYRYEYNSGGGYLTESGVHTTSLEESLGDGWFHAWNTFTTQPTAALGYTGLWYYQYNVGDKVSIAAVSIVPGNTIRPARQLIPSGTTRSNTQGLLNIPRTNGILDLSNMTYDSKAQFYFDGINDYISLNTLTPSPAGLTMSVVARINSASSSWVRFFDFGNGQNIDNLLFCRYSNTSNLFFGVYNGSTNNYTIGGTLQFDQLAMYTATADGTNFRIYVNGQLVHTEANSTVPTATTRTSNYLGRSNWPDPYLNGQIPVAQIYNRALSAGEVLQNYNHYKTRYNLP